MKTVTYFIQFILILILFLLFKILGLRYASKISSKLVSLIGPFLDQKE